MRPLNLLYPTTPEGRSAAMTQRAERLRAADALADAAAGYFEEPSYVGVGRVRVALDDYRKVST